MLYVTVPESPLGPCHCTLIVLARKLSSSGKLPSFKQRRVLHTREQGTRGNNLETGVVHENSIRDPSVPRPTIGATTDTNTPVVAPGTVQYHC